MRNMRALVLGTVALACAGTVSETAQAQVAFGAGATFPQVVYRQLFDCAYSQAQGSTGKPGPLAKSSACGGFNSTQQGGIILYAGIGSGGGKKVLRLNDPNAITDPLNNYTISASIPYTSSDWGITQTNGGLSAGGYDGIQFAGSDDILNAADIAAWKAGGASSAQSKFGNVMQIPTLVGPVGIGFNGTDGNGNPLNIVNSPATGPGGTTGTSGLNLDRQALCGIVSGHITEWDDPYLATLNGNTTLGAGHITFVHRTDGSGTTFLLSNALVAQCRGIYGPKNASPTASTDLTTVSYEFPWTDNAGACAGLYVNKPTGGANTLNWPDDHPNDQCGNPVANPGGGHYANASGTGALVNIVAGLDPLHSGNGTIGYASADYWAPYKTGGKPTANLQSQWDVTLGTGKFQPMTWQGAQIAISGAVPQFADATTRGNPLAWSLQGVAPNPSIKDAYPIAGFTWMEMYQCYQHHANGLNTLTPVLQWINYLYGAGTPILNANGFAQVPYAWLLEISTLLQDPNYQPNFVDASAACSGKAGAY